MTQSNKEPLLEKGVVLNDKWEIIQHIATGGMGEVYKARQLNLEREVAVKIISQELLDAHGDDEEEKQAELARFRREVLAMAQVRHPNVLQVYDHGVAGLAQGGVERSLEYTVMEYIPGPTLKLTMPPEGFGGNEAGFREWVNRYFMPMLEGVEAIHQRGIVHRDLKPSNVLLDDMTPKIMDFGLVGGARWKPVTRSHHVLGTLAYMAPEQFMELADTDVRADVYSLGKILYEAMVGKLGKDNMFPLKTASLPSQATPLLTRLDRLIRQATAEERSQRLPNIKTLRVALLEALGPDPAQFETRNRHRKIVMGVLVLALILAIALTWGLWYHFRGVESHEQARSEPSFSATSAGSQASVAGGTPPPEIVCTDGSVLRLIPSGEVETGTGGTVNLPAFYLAETQVTNLQFVEFLNQMGDRLQVNEGIVRGLDGDVWLHLGEVRKGAEPIVYSQGVFKLKDPLLSAHPVVRVTGLGAMAYVAHNGKRLPTSAEWVRAAQPEAGAPPLAAPSPAPTKSDSMEEMHARRATTPPTTTTDQFYAVSHYPPNSFGIRGLEGNVGGWTRSSMTEQPDGDKTMVIMGGSENPAREDSGQRRPAWEGLDWVGFRCAQDVPAPRE